MPWTVPGRKPTPAEYWDSTYKDVGKWSHQKGGEKLRTRQALQLMAGVYGKHVVDLGGGPLLGQALFANGAGKVLVVDHSIAGCELAKCIEPRVDVLVEDVTRFLDTNLERFDFTVAMGILDYVPHGFLQQLFEKAPSDELVINTPVCEAYIHQYDTRVCVSSRKDIADAVEKYGWWLECEFPSPEHVFAKYKRN